MKLDCALSMDALQEVPEVARAAEETGFAGMWANDTKHNPFVTLALAAPSTSRLELGTGVAVAFARSPMVTAQTAWDLARLSGGRFLLGLGTQVKAHIERRFGFAWDPPVPKLREYVQVLRAVWRSWQEGMPLRVEGEYYRISLMAPFFDPGPNLRPRIPIFIAGVGRLLCQLAGEVGDGFVVHPLHSVPYIREVVLPNIAAGLAKSGRARGDVQLYAPVFLALGETPAEVDAAASRTRARMASPYSPPSHRAGSAITTPHSVPAAFRVRTASSVRGSSPWAGRGSIRALTSANTRSGATLSVRTSEGTLPFLWRPARATASAR